MYNAHVITHLRRLQGMAKINGMSVELRRVRDKLIRELDDCLNGI